MEAAQDTMAGLIRVWLVEDEAHYRQTFSYLVDQTAGMRCVQTYADGEAVLARLEGMNTEASSPDVVLMDINLPGINGIECVSLVKARLPETQIVMLTIHDEEDTIFEAFRAGASGYLLKNAPLDVILAAIREASRGGVLIPPQVARKVLHFFTREIPTPSNYDLTERERDVLQKMVEGLSQKEIAAQLFVSPSTVNSHIQHIYEKLHVHSSSAAVAKAIRERLV